jgi:hypothetical protein
MKAVNFVLLLSVPVALAAVEIRTGDSLQDVRSNLGAPRGQLQVGDRQVLYYDRGEVDLRAGAVTRVALLSDADFTAQQARQATEAARKSEENSRLNLEGEAIKASKLADAAFAAAPLSYQLAFWQEFSRRYPGVSVGEQLSVAHARLAEYYNEHQAQEERLAELEARVSEAESRADAAESHASNFATYVSDSGYGYGYGYGYGRSSGYGDSGRNRRGSSGFPVQYHFFPAPVPIMSPMNRPMGGSRDRGSQTSDSATCWDQRGSNGGSSGSHRGRL